ncbi:hypothetical protein, partial [Nocardia sp. NBC_01503]|uniref:hypothetical protein n=1 Tax=Nocardia sp. NBC_01503 TaxID=2975997 RepID=UPI002E7C24EA
GNALPPGRAYIRINELLGGGGATFKIFKGTELTIGGHGIGLALLLIAFGPVAVIVVGTYAGLPVLLIVLLAVLVLIGVVGVTVMIVKLLGNSSRDQP